jgi:hypothetical protein
MDNLYIFNFFVFTFFLEKVIKCFLTHIFLLFSA